MTELSLASLDEMHRAGFIPDATYAWMRSHILHPWYHAVLDTLDDLVNPLLTLAIVVEAVAIVGFIFLYGLIAIAGGAA